MKVLNSNWSACLLPGVLFIFGGVGGIHGQSLELSSVGDKQPIGKSLFYLEDKTTELTIWDILKREYPPAGKNPEALKWLKNDKDGLGFGFSKSNYWIKFRAKNITYSPLAYYLLQESAIIDFLDLYVVEQGKMIRHYPYGDDRYFDVRKIKYRTFVFPLSLEPGAEQVYYMRYSTATAVAANLSIWDPETFQEFRNNESVILWMYYGLMLVMILYNLFIFLSVRDISYLYYVIFIAAFALYTMAFNGLAFQYLWPESIWWAGNCRPILVNVFSFFLVLFSRNFIEIKKYWKAGYYILTGLALLSLFLFLSTIFVESYRIRMVMATALGGVQVIVLVPIVIWVSAKHRLRSGLFFCGAFFAFFAGAALSILSSFNVIPASFFSNFGMQLGSAVEVVLLSLGLADRINVLKKELEVMNVGLEQTVEERTSELQDTLKTVQVLKTRQDGDYFLTSLILNPLQDNHNSSNFVKSETILRQFKKFSFREKDADLGGDICITSKIILQNQSFVFFTNADAMGKSMQGAGGALVYGAAIRARLLQAEVESQNRTPELWLRDLFYELHGLFESFDGSMMISSVIGLIAEESGYLWFINAEHPWVCLYRDGQASYIEEDLSNRKLGMPDIEKVQLKTYQLQSGDELIVGSDGKDDIVMGEQDSREMNYDEQLFLDWVKQGNGKLEEILRLITENSELKDDISLISLVWNNRQTSVLSGENRKDKKLLSKAYATYKSQDFQEALDLIVGGFNGKGLNMDALNLTGKILLKQNQFQKYYELRVKYYRLFPGDNTNLLKLSRVCFAMQNYEEALEWSDSLQLRTPEDPKNITHMARIYKKLGNEQKAYDLIIGMMEKTPDNLELMRLEELYKPLEDVGANEDGGIVAPVSSRSAFFYD